MAALMGTVTRALNHPLLVVVEGLLLDERSVVHAMLFAIAANSVSKMGLALGSGGRMCGAIISAGLGLILLAAWVPALL